jgi:hypothetical protein
MSFLKNIFGRSKLDGEALALSQKLEEYAQLHLLSHFETPAPLHNESERKRWDKVLPRPYESTIELFQKQGWLVQTGEVFQMTDTAAPFVAMYQQRLSREKAEAMAAVRKALEERDTSEALAIRRRYEARFPLGKAEWTGPEPQLSHSALTRRILFLDHWLVADLSPETQKWLKLYAAEQHLWGANWRLPATDIPESVQAELATAEMNGVERAYWRAYQLGLYVENQETWQRCKGGDHVRRIEIGGANDEYTCEHCRSVLGEVFLVSRVPELPHKECTSPRGCRCRYLPVLDTYDNSDD